METFSSIQVYAFPDTTIIAGSYKELRFNAFYQSGSFVDLTSGSVEWTLSPYADPAFNEITKSGTGANGYFTITLESSDTLGLSGLFIHKATIMNAFGISGRNYVVGRGTIRFIPAIQI